MKLFDNLFEWCTPDGVIHRRRRPEETIPTTPQYVRDVIMKKIVGPHQEKINKILHRSDQT